MRFSVANLNRVANDAKSPVVASEFTTTSITSQPVAQKALDERRSENPSLLLLDGSHRGYLRLDITRERLRGRPGRTRRRQAAQARARVQASYVVSGRPGSQRA